MDTARHDSADRIRIAQLTGTVQRLAYPLYKHDPSYNQDTAVAELQAISTDPHLLAHAVGASGAFLHPAVKQLLLAAGANAEDLDTIAARIEARSQMPR